MGLLDYFNAPELKPNEPYRGYEQPEWKLAPNQPEDGSFQIRCYPAAQWTTTTASTETENNNRPFWKLFGYIQGKNNKEQKMSMTVPVTMQMPRDEAKQTSYTMSFYTPKVHQGSAPEPENSEVFIENRKEIVVYVRNFSGFAKRPQYREQAKLLYDDLLKHGIDGSTVDPEVFYAVGYDSPFRLVNRRNEVWLLSKTE